MKKLKMNFSSYKDAQFDQLAKKVFDSMTSNPIFTTPIPALTVLETAITEYVSALSKAKNGSVDDTHRKQKAREALTDILTDLALYVQLTARHSEQHLQSSGFELTKEKNAVGILEKPKGFEATPGKVIGSVALRVKAVHGAHSYLYEYREYPPTPESNWMVHTDTKAKTIIYNLQEGKKYVFRVAGVGTDPHLIYSAEIICWSI